MALDYAGNFVAMFFRNVWLIHGLWKAIPANVVNAGLIKPGKELTMKLRSACRRELGQREVQERAIRERLEQRSL